MKELNITMNLPKNEIKSLMEKSYHEHKLYPVVKGSIRESEFMIGACKGHYVAYLEVPEYLDSHSDDDLYGELDAHDYISYVGTNYWDDKTKRMVGWSYDGHDDFTYANYVMFGETDGDRHCLADFIMDIGYVLGQMYALQ